MLLHLRRDRRRPKVWSGDARSARIF